MSTHGGWSLHLVMKSKAGFIYRFWDTLSNKEIRLTKYKTKLISDLEMKEQKYKRLADEYHEKINQVCKETLKRALNNRKSHPKKGTNDGK